MTEKLNISDAAIEILQATNDGDDLIPNHLKLVEDAVNGFLNEDGLKVFQILLETVRGGYFKTRANQIATLNDELRTSFNTAKGRILSTEGFMSIPLEDQLACYNLVKRFNQFTKENDPYGEHDSGRVKHNGYTTLWKIDYYDKSLEYGSPDPADPEVTTRVLTIMLGHEY